MKTLSLERLARLGELASADPLFQQYGRRFHGDLSLGCGDQSASFRIEGGRVTGVSLADNPEAPIRLLGDEGAWEALWEGLNGGLHRAWRHRMIRFEGNPQAIYGYWKMIWRFGDLMVAAKWGD
jgi:hypothetical protein